MSLNIVATPRNATINLSELLTKKGRYELLEVPSIRAIALELWRNSETELGFNTAVVRAALLENETVLKAMNAHLSSVASKFAFEFNGQVLTGATAIEAASKHITILYVTAKRLGEAHTEAERKELIEAGVYASTGENGQVLPVAKAAQLNSLVAQFREMGLNTVPNRSGLGKMKNIVI
jgi:hypothetical protein